QDEDDLGGHTLGGDAAQAAGGPFGIARKNDAEGHLWVWRGDEIDLAWRAHPRGYPGVARWLRSLTHAPVYSSAMRCGCHCRPSAMIRSSSCGWATWAGSADWAKSSSAASCGFAFASITYALPLESMRKSMRA